MKLAGVKINEKGKIYYFDSNDLNLKVGLNVVVSTEKGLQFGKVAEIINEKGNSNNYKEVIRIASKKDYLQYLKNQDDAEKALAICKEMVEKNKLNMTIIDVSYNFERSQFLFRFLSDERVDFRQLAKDLGSKLKTRIELRQIGVRDKAREIGGFGPCGRLLCCNTFLSNFDTVSINMAKSQGLALNPTKINGACGRLLCCLNYENDLYVDARRSMPDVGKKVTFQGRECKVISVDPLKEKYKVLTSDNEVIEIDNSESKK